MSHRTKPWDIRIVSKEVTTGAWWWKEVRTHTEAYLIMRIESVLCMIGMAEGKFGMMVENSQFAGEITANHLQQQTFRINAKGDIKRFWHAVGRSHIDGQPLDGFKAIAYIFGLEDWKEADMFTLLHHKAKEE